MAKLPPPATSAMPPATFGAGLPVATYNDTELQTQYLYGSSRLGSFEVAPQTEEPQTSSWSSVRKLGTRSFELSNHLGNVLATVSDKKLAEGNGFTTDVTTTSDWPASPVLPLRPDHERQKLAE